MSSGTLMGMTPRIAFPASAAIILFACKGGSGDPSAGYQATQERAPISFEEVGVLEEGVGRSNEAVPSTAEGNPAGGGGGGASGIDCNGTYRCTISAAGQSAAYPVPIRFKSGSCTSSQGGFNSDGTITKDGVVVGRYTGNANGFTVTGSTQTEKNGTVEFTLDCTRTSDAAPSDDDDDDVTATAPSDGGTVTR